jgi:hypothetical protein
MKQLHNAESRIPDQPLQIDGHDVELISVVARVQAINVQSTAITLSLDDGTAAPMEFKQWVNQDGNNDTKFKYVFIKKSINIVKEKVITSSVSLNSETSTTRNNSSHLTFVELMIRMS